MNKKSLLLSAMLGFTLVFSASAQAESTVNWTGFYGGVFVESMEGNTRQDNSFPATTGDYDIDGENLGLIAGYRHHYSNDIVWGLSADIAFSNVEGETLNTCTSVCYSEIDTLANFRVSAGYAIDKYLPFVNVGFAVGQVDAGTRQDLGDGIDLGDKTFNVGLTYGLGLEAAISEDFNLRIEYNRTDLDEVTYFIPLQGQTGTVPFEDIDSFRIVLTFKF